MLVLVSVVVAASACGSGAPVERSTATVPQADPDAPNVVVIMTDDQTVEQMRVMTRTNELLRDEGTNFTNFVTSFPLCCPSRATFLTGQYAFNHGVVDNIGPDGGYYQLDNRNTLAVWLQRAGYATDFVGHYLYRYGTRERTEVPPGGTAGSAPSTRARSATSGTRSTTAAPCASTATPSTTTRPT